MVKTIIQLPNGKRYRWVIFFIIFITIIMVSYGVFYSIKPKGGVIVIDNDELKRLGYYVYDVPESLLVENSWKRIMSIVSSSNCSFGLAKRYHTINILYMDNNGTIIMSIIISPQIKGLYYFGESQSILVNEDWVHNESGVYYTKDKNIVLRVVDKSGLKVIFSGYNMSLYDLLAIINNLEIKGNHNKKLGSC